MVTRRQFLGHFTLAAGAAGLAGLLPRHAFALTQGGGPATWASTSDVTVFAQAWAARFTNTLPNPLDPTLLGIGFIYRPDGGSGNTYTVTAGEILWNVLGPAGSGLPATRVWGYGNYEGVAAGVPVTFPGRSFVVQRGAAIHVNWVNNLAVGLVTNGQPVVDASGNLVTDGNLPLSHLVGVDQTIAMTNDHSRATRVGDNIVYSGADIVGVPIAVHHHGGDTGSEFDGGPDQWETPRRLQKGPGISASFGNTNATDDRLRYTYDNTQEASIHWYHDHGEGVTRTNAYCGLAGLYVIRDANEAALVSGGRIPGYPYELPLVIQDKVFAADGSLAYPGDPADYPEPGLNLPSPTHVPEMFGDISVVNGVAWPNCWVEPREYRLRLLNGSDSRFYTLKFGHGGTSRRGGFNRYLEIHKLSNDLGFLNNPVRMPGQSVTIAPGERMDIVVDFGAVQPQDDRRGPASVIVTNSANTPFPGGGPTVPGGMGMGTIMRFEVSLPYDGAAPRTRVGQYGGGLQLRGYDAGTPRLAPPVVTRRTPVRRVLLAEGADEYGRIMPQLGSFQLPGDPPYKYYRGQSNLGTLAFTQLPTETPRVGTDEVWEFWNTTVDAHPIHLHLAQFRVLNREAFVPTAAAPLDPATGEPMVSVAKDMVNGWQGSVLKPEYVALSGNVRRAPPDEQSWKDTVVCQPGEVTRVVMTFKRPGKFVYHCHILSHEEHDMMRWYEVL